MPSLSAQDEKSASLEEGEEGVSLEEGEGKVGGGQGSLGSFESVLIHDLLLPPSPATPPLGSYTAADDDDERSPGNLRRALSEFSDAALEEGARVVGAGVAGIHSGGQGGGGEGGAARTVVFPEEDAVALRDSSPFGSLLAPWRYWTRAAPVGHRGEGEGEGGGDWEGDEEPGSEKREEIFGSCADFSAASGFMPIAGFKPKMNLLEVAIEKELEEKKRADEMNSPARLPTTGLLAVAAQSEDAGSEEGSGSPSPLSEVVGSGAERLPEERWADMGPGLGGVGVTSHGGSRSPAARVTSPSMSPTSASQKTSPDSRREVAAHDFSRSPSGSGPSGLLPEDAPAVGASGVDVVVPTTPPPLPPTLPTALSLSLSLSASTPSPLPRSLSPASEAEDASRRSQSPARSLAQAPAPSFAAPMLPVMSPVMSPAISAAMPPVVSPAGSSTPSTQGKGEGEAAAPPPLPPPEMETLRQASPSPSSDRQDASMGEAAGNTAPGCREQAETKDLACPEAPALPAAPVVSPHSPAPSPWPRGASMTSVGVEAPTGSRAPEGRQSILSTPPTVVTATASPERKAPVRRGKRERERERERERAPRNRAVAAAHGQVQAQAQAQAPWAPKPSAQFHAGKAPGPARAQPARAPAWGMPSPLLTPEPHPALTGVKPPPLQVPAGCFAGQSRAAPPRLASMPFMPLSSPLPPPLPPPPPLVLPVSSLSAPSQLVFTPPSPSGRSTSASPTSTRSSPLLVRPPLLPLGVLSGRDIGASGPGIPLVWSWSDSTLSGCSRSAGRGGGFSSVSASVSSSGRGESPLVGIRFVAGEGALCDGDSDRETLWEVAGRTAAGVGVRSSPSRCAVGRLGEEEAGGAAAAAAVASAAASAAAMSAAASAAAVAATVAAESSLEGGVGGRQGKRPRRYFFP